MKHKVILEVVEQTEVEVDAENDEQVLDKLNQGEYTELGTTILRGDVMSILPATEVPDGKAD